MHLEKRFKGKTIRVLAAVLATVMTINTAAPMTVLAAEDTVAESVNSEETLEDSTADGIVEEETTEDEIVEEETTEDEIVKEETTEDEIVEEETTENKIVEEETTEDEVVEEETTEDEIVEEETTEDEIVEEETAEDEIVEEEITEDVIVEEQSTEETVVESYALKREIETEDTVSDYATFLSCLKILERYAADYAGSHAGEDKIELVINFIRTGVERYLDGSWVILAGVEKTEFTSYVKAQDELNGTNASALKNLEYFNLPNGDQVDFGHMFGCMNITYYMAATNPTQAMVYADLSGWAGDLADLMEATVNEVEVDELEIMIAGVRKQLASDDPESHGFGLDDIYGDLDGYYIMNNLEGGKTISKVMENYFNENLTANRRATYFVKNRLNGSGTHAEIREAVFNAYSSNEMIKNLEASKGVSDANELRKACCYAFADYLYELTGNLSEETSNRFYTVFNSSASTVAPGVTQEIKYALTADEKQIVYYIATADITRNDVDVYANYRNNDGSEWGMARVADQMEAALKNHSDPSNPSKYIPNYNPVVGVNGDFFNMTTGEPSGALVMEGVKYHDTGNSTFFGILKDGTPVLGTAADFRSYGDQIQEAIGGSTILVKNGKSVVSASATYYNDRAPRTCVGITADNKVVLMVLDGRQEPISAGGAMAELAQIMLDAGCVSAMNLDGGGSTTFIAKEEGSDELSVINRPSDDIARSVSSSLMVVSTAKPSTEFDHALVTSDYDYLTIGTSTQITASGVSVSGGSAPLPEGAYLKLTDESVGTLDENGMFTATANGDVQVQVIAGNAVVGKKTLHVVVPDALAFEKERISAIYGVPIELPLVATYNGNKVAINANDIMVGIENESAGIIEGLTFIGNEESGIRSVLIAAVLAVSDEAVAITQINLYKENEAMFDFDNATSGNRQFAWERKLENTITEDEVTYRIDDFDKNVDGTYTFALDMQEIPIPEKLLPLISFLPGGDNADATAWGFLLQLAERVSVLTNVTVELTVDPNYDVDYSNLTVVNEYFEHNSTTFNEEANTLTITFNWIDQTTAIDPATANALCILSGIKFTPKEGAAEVIDSVMNGTVTYDIYLRANAVYSMAQDPEVQEEYGLYPFINPDIPTEKGGHFANVFIDFKDTFVLDRSMKNGWIKESDGNLYYYKDNVACQGIQKLPSQENEAKEYYYEFDSNGVCKGKVNGMIKMNGQLYYAVLGELRSGWRSIEEDGKINCYYFDPVTYKAVDGKQQIDGYTYNFENRILVRGQLVMDEGGTHYMWAGDWVANKWVTIDGYMAYPQRNSYFKEGPNWQASLDGDSRYYAFDEYGLWDSNRNGFFDYEGKTYLTKDGYVLRYPGLVAIDGAYYYFDNSDAMVKDCIYWITRNNGLLPMGQYQIDKTGRVMKNGKVLKAESDSVTEPEQGETPETDSGTYGAVVRIYGQTRYETSYAVADVLKETIAKDKFDTVVLASGKNYPDALSGAYLAVKKNAPILMASESNAADLQKYIKENLKSGGTIYVLGGVAACPDSIVAGLEAYSIKRLAGATRYETNLAILKEAGIANEDILICNANGFADSLSASASGRPILLVNDKLTGEQKEFLETVRGNNFYIIGLEAAINKNIEANIRTYGSTERIGGATRYETSVMIAEKFFDNPENAVITYAKNFPDGLCGGPLAMSMDAPLILTVTNEESIANKYMKANGIKSGVVLGGSTLISDNATRKVFGLDEKVSIIKK